MIRLMVMETYGGGGNDVSTGVEIAKEANQYDMKVCLIFIIRFLGRTMVQLVPKAWKKDVNNTEKMCSDVYDFTKESIQKFKDAGANIGNGSVGNEVPTDFLEYTLTETKENLLMLSGEIKRNQQK